MINEVNSKDIYIIPKHFYSLVYTYNKIKHAKFELLNVNTNYEKIYLNMQDIKNQMSHEINSDFIDIDNKYIYNTAIEIEHETQRKQNFYKILVLLNDLRRHIGYD